MTTVCVIVIVIGGGSGELYARTTCGILGWWNDKGMSTSRQRCGQ